MFGQVYRLSIPSSINHWPGTHRHGHWSVCQSAVSGTMSRRVTWHTSRSHDHVIDDLRRHHVNTSQTCLETTFPGDLDIGHAGETYNAGWAMLIVGVFPLVCDTVCNSSHPACKIFFVSHKMHFCTNTNTLTHTNMRYHTCIHKYTNTYMQSNAFLDFPTSYSHTFSIIKQHQDLLKQK